VIPGTLTHRDPAARRRHPRRPHTTTGLSLVFVLVVACSFWLPARSAAAASAASAAAPWPTSPAWQSYVETPTSTVVCPTAVVSTAGSVSGAANLLCGGSGGTTLTLAAGGTTPTIVLDYGKEVGGEPFFTVSAETGSPGLKAGYSESLQYASASGDGGTPWGEGDSARSDNYTVTGAGTITNRYVQGGERYEEITLTSAGSLTLSGLGINYIADRTQAAGYPGYFVSSSDQLNKIWYDGAYTAQIDSVPTGSLPGTWQIAGGALDAIGSSGNNGAGVLNQGTSWGDYTSSFQTEIVANQSGWMVRGQDAIDGYAFILNDSADTAGTPNTLQEFDVHGGIYTGVGSVTLPTALAAGTWHTVATTVSGTSITVSLDSQPLTSLNSASFPSGTTAYSTGTIGFREYTGEEAYYRNLSVVSSSGATLYSSALSTAANLADFTAPGVNALPSMLDGAKRDRAIWIGDMNVEGPTDFYSFDNASYIKGSLELLGSYQLSSGFVTGALPPQDSLHTGSAISGTTGTYSATYSMYFVTALELYYLYTGDLAFVNQEWPVVQAELAWNATQLDSNGLFVTDASDGADWDFYDGDKTGEVSAYNMLYYKTLLDGATLATAAGQSSQAATYTANAAALKSAINAHLYNSSTGLYGLSNTQMTAVAQDANALAVLWGVAPAANDAAILATLKTDLWTTPYGPLPFSNGLGYSSVISPFVGGFELNARYATNDTVGAESLLATEWGHMIASGSDQTGTMWENVSGSDGTPGLGTTTSLSHGWSTMPTSALSGYVLGVQPATAGYATWTVQPHPGSLAWAEGRVPTPHGNLGISWAGERGVGLFSMNVTAPGGTTGTIAVPTYGAANPIVSVNGNVVWSGSAFAATAGITGAHADANYVYLTGVQPGSYIVASNPGGYPTPTGYTACSSQNGTCSFTGTESVAYGANGIYSYTIATGGTACTDTALGDPDYGVVKSCYVGAVVTGPSGTTYCAAENGLCSFTGTRNVAYGAGSSFKTMSVTGGTPCSNAAFGDPDYGVVKACFLAP
jgi:alpha-L-rhamnosidase